MSQGTGTYAEALIVIFAVILGSFATCAVVVDVHRSLPNDYSIVYASSTDCAIRDSTSMVVVSNVADWSVDGTVIFGRLQDGRMYVFDTETRSTIKSSKGEEIVAFLKQNAIQLETAWP